MRSHRAEGAGTLCGMIIIAGSLSFDPADRDDVLASLAEVTEASRRDAGCLEYFWGEDLEAPNTFRFFECWESQELLDAHLAAPHEVAFGERNLRRITGATASFFEASPTAPIGCPRPTDAAPRRLLRGEVPGERSARDARSVRLRLLQVAEVHPVGEDRRRQVVAAAAGLHGEVAAVALAHRDAVEILGVVAAGADVGVQVLHVDLARVLPPPPSRRNAL